MTFPLMGAPYMDIRSHLERFYEAQWRRGSAQWISNDVACTNLRNGRPTPVNYCVSTVARLCFQPHSPMDKVLETLRILSPVDGGVLYQYPRRSLHFTLLGCTQRLPRRSLFTKTRINTIAAQCERILTGAGRTVVNFQGLCISESQIFLQGFPRDLKWAELRSSVETSMKAIGETPISYPNPQLPVFLNIARLATMNPSHVRYLLGQVERLRAQSVGDVVVGRVELMIADQVLSPQRTRRVTYFRL